MTPRRHAGDLILVVRKSHRWLWWPHPYRHVDGGYACHWLGLFLLWQTPMSVPAPRTKS